MRDQIDMRAAYQSGPTGDSAKSTPCRDAAQGTLPFARITQAAG
jgi:hypothetical protein